MAIRPVNRTVSYQWRLREIMATRGLFNATDLEPLLAERGINLSSVQVWRLVTQIPERLSLPALAALCDILDVTPADLITTRADNAARPAAAASGGGGGGGGGGEVDPDALRPRRARLKPAP